MAGKHKPQQKPIITKVVVLTPKEIAAYEARAAAAVARVTSLVGESTLRDLQKFCEAHEQEWAKLFQQAWADHPDHPDHPDSIGLRRAKELLRDAAADSKIKASPKVLEFFQFLLRLAGDSPSHEVRKRGLLGQLEADTYAAAAKRRSSKGGANSHTEHRELKKRALTLYKAGKTKAAWKSMRAAARAIFPQLPNSPERRRDALTDTTGEDTVYDWIREYEQGIRTTNKI
jgi:hypothetical protein